MCFLHTLIRHRVMLQLIVQLEFHLKVRRRYGVSTVKFRDYCHTYKLFVLNNDSHNSGFQIISYLERWHNL